MAKRALLGVRSVSNEIKRSMTWEEIDKELREIGTGKRMLIAGLIDPDDALITPEMFSKLVKDLKDKGLLKDKGIPKDEKFTNKCLKSWESPLSGDH